MHIMHSVIYYDVLEYCTTRIIIIIFLLSFDAVV